MEAEEAQGGGPARQEEGGGGWRKGRAFARLHQEVVRGDPAGTLRVSVHVRCSVFSLLRDPGLPLPSAKMWNNNS